ncbi:GNAT family N-acetyltransferase [Actinospica durhamensis]|uniref:GNAT family N-acetyltransferase n=1 Tax=Actinospica durhamensis TaxID=1508375 RepID=A0A941IKE2_9ACTN|nr:GNAT family N-acetyltransferase [Actinospica durhamensis]MBR7831750.1 GNAT family N-acetyltransferase [Actinospica durhamensis]
MAFSDIASFDPVLAQEAELHEYLAVTHDYISEVSPDLPLPRYDAFVAELRNPATVRGPREFWVARHAGRIVGTAEFTYLSHENSRYALAQVRVTRDARRRGVGSALLAAGLERAKDMLRDSVIAYNLHDGTAGLAWVQALGFTVVQRFVWQTLHVGKADPALWSVPVPDGFRIERWTCSAPDSIVESFARARTAIEDAPGGASGVRPPAWTAARVRENERGFTAEGADHRCVVAVHEETGEVAGLTEIAIIPALPDTCFQADTAVLAEHRGRGLGRAMKSTMMRWLVADRPTLAEVRTTTAADNVHMIRVNTQLGYETTATLNTVEAAVGQLDFGLYQGTERVPERYTR